MHNPHFPQFVDHPDVKIPALWHKWNPKWWPCNQEDENGVIHKLKYSYTVHYIDVEKLKILNMFGDYISQFEWAYSTQQGNRFRQIGALATDWVMSEKSLSFCKRWLNPQSRVYCVAAAIALSKGGFTPQDASHVYCSSIGCETLGYLFSSETVNIKNIRTIKRGYRAS